MRFVAKRLRRAHVTYDEFSFEAGQDFREAIEKGLDDSVLFVFFASRDSIKSVYCKFEVDLAQLKRMEGGIENQLVIIIDPQVAFSGLPKWMRTAKALLQTKPTQAVRDIEQALYVASPKSERGPFVGRTAELGDFAEALSNSESNVFVINGLDGIGRRSFLERACGDYLGLRLGPYFLLDETRGIEDLYLELFEETADIATRKQLASEMLAFSGLCPEEKTREVVSKLHILAQDKNVPCVIDRGGLLSETGEYDPQFDSVIQAFASSDEDHYLAVVQRRRVFLRREDGREWLTIESIPPLSLNDSRLLLAQLFRAAQIQIERPALEQVAQMIGGYPPAAYFAATYSRIYGVDALLADRTVLGDYKARNFTRLLTDLNLSGPAWTALQYLASEVAVPLQAIAIAVDCDVPATGQLIKSLIDLCLVVLYGDAYALSPPIKEAVERARGYLPAEEYSRIAAGLTTLFWDDNNVAPSLHVVDATLHAVARSSNRSLQRYEDLVRPSTIHRLATECYHRKQWELALEYSRRVQTMDPSRRDVWSIEFKALIQLERWDEAEAVLLQMERSRDRIAYYLKGFGLRKRGQHPEACKAFEQALRIGDKANSVYRDYADSLYRLGEYERAAEMVKVVLEKDPANVYVLDLLARVYLDSGELAEAEGVVQQLDRYDISRRFIFHRRAALYARRQLWDLALVDADAACDIGVSPFESFAQRANILIELDRLDEARAAVESLENRFSTHGRDVRRGLTCKLLIREGRWREARSVWDQLDDKHRTVHRHLLLQILRLLEADATSPLYERQRARLTIQQLESEPSVADAFF